jgi:hypothetical protein
VAEQNDRNRIGRRAMAGLVVAAMGILLWFAPKRQPATGPPADPVDRVTAMIDAARTGDVPGYLACLSGSALRQAESQIGGDAERFGEFLRAGLAGLNGLAFHDQEQPAADRLRLTVERVFADYNERQTLELVRVGDRWSIQEMSPMARYVPTIRYGTPVAPAATQ